MWKMLKSREMAEHHQSLSVLKQRCGNLLHMFRIQLTKHFFIPGSWDTNSKSFSRVQVAHSNYGHVVACTRNEGYRFTSHLRQPTLQMNRGRRIGATFSRVA